MVRSYQKHSDWADQKKKLFPHQLGFTCPPHDFDAAPSDFIRMAPPTVGVHGRMLHVPDYSHSLSQRKQNFGLLEEFVECMANNGVDVCAQVGSNWVHASGLGVSGIENFCRKISEKYETPFHMSGYAMVEALRDCNVEKIALNGAYHPRDWWQGTVAFLKEAGFDVVWAGNFYDQGFFESQEQVNACRWCFDGDLAEKSFRYIAEQAADVDAYVIIGMCNFRTGPAGQAQRPVHLEVALEKIVGKPVIGHDSALYWRVFKTLKLAPVTKQGALLSSLKGA